MIASHLDRLDVWQRNVPWSQAKQLRTVVETELSVDDIFDFLAHDKDCMTRNLAKRLANYKKLQQSATGSYAYPFIIMEHNTVCALMYRILPLPW